LLEVPHVLRKVNTLGQHVLAFFAFFGQLVYLLGETLRGLTRNVAEPRQTIKQMAQIGIDSLPIVAVTMFFSGMVLAYHVAQQASKLGVGDLVGWLVAETMTRELGPVLTAIVVSARAGSAMTAEIGTMKVTEQIDALRAMATNPVDYLVVPRLKACFIMVPLLALVGDVVGVVGGYIMSVVTPGINHAAYFINIPGNLKPWTITGGLIKDFAFAVIIAIIACHQGLTCRMASEEVGRATTRSVVYCIMLVYTFDLLMTAIVYPG
jgi:phospholipid/cholesterol/gamma-HCH transport system permease protein